MLPSLIWITEYETGQYALTFSDKLSLADKRQSRNISTLRLLLDAHLFLNDKKKTYGVDLNVLLHKNETLARKDFLCTTFDQSAKIWIAAVGHFLRLEEMHLV